MEPVLVPVLITAIFLLLFAFAVILNHLVYQYMLKASPALISLTNLNSVYAKELAGSRGQIYRVHIKCRSKTQFDSHTIEYAFSLYLLGHYKTYKPIYERYKRDTAAYKAYMAQYSYFARELPNYASQRANTWQNHLFSRLEAKIYENQQLKPPSFRVNVLKTYDSPKKRNHYSEHTAYYSNAFVKLCDTIFAKIDLREKAKEQRELMTPTLRYQIMKRDGFTCVICGRSAADGAVLNVDHYIPVSKGGKTVPENLRTLCAICNAGKGGSFDPNGKN